MGLHSRRAEGGDPRDSSRCVLRLGARGQKAGAKFQGKSEVSVKEAGPEGGCQRNQRQHSQC